MSSTVITEEMKRDFVRRGYSRRNFGKISTLLGAGAASLPFFNERAMAQLSMLSNAAPDAVRINANENPMGPCAEALDAMHNVLKNGGRYQYEETFNFAKTLADVEGVKQTYVRPFPGSSDPLHRAVLAFTSPEKSFVIGDPGYEAGERAAHFIGAKVVRVPLRKDYSHDVKAMATADPNAGVIYLCNPNNPTGTITARSDIEWLYANKPKGTLLLVDEAYIHLSKNAMPMCDYVAQDKDVMILRTFSKIYGMAGLRAGAAIARPDLLEKISGYGAGAMPVTGMIGANVSLKVKTLVPERRKVIGDIREDVFDWMHKKNYTFVPSESNKFMVDVKRPGGEVVRAMAGEKVYIGRVWAAWPTYVRVSVGTKDEMAKFKAAFEKVMNA